MQTNKSKIGGALLVIGASVLCLAMLAWPRQPIHELSLAQWYTYWFGLMSCMAGAHLVVQSMGRRSSGARRA